jgi:hypothetical protein
VTFDPHLEKVLVWKENHDEFIEELVDQDIRDVTYGEIKGKLKMTEGK